MAYEKPTQTTPQTQDNPIWVCHRCGKQIDNDGWLIINARAALTTFLEPEPWRAYHYHCAPEPTADDWEIRVDRVDTWDKVRDVTRQLKAKRWVGGSNWDEFVVDAGGLDA